MQPNTWKYFPFPEISISGKYVFSGKRFTATKHSLSVTIEVLPYFLLGIGFCLFVVVYIHGKAFLWSKKLFIYLFIFTWKLILVLFALHSDFSCLGYIH